MRKDGLITLALLVTSDPCGDDDRDWMATWTMADGSTVEEAIIDPIINTPPMLRGATAVRVNCPKCHRFWQVIESGGLILGEIGVAS